MTMNVSEIREKAKQTEKELIWAEPPDSGIYDPCGTRIIHNVDVHIHIPAKGLQLEALFQAESLLRQVGVSFDTGYGCGGRDWEFDFSLKGAYVKFRCHVDEKEQKRRWYENQLRDEYTDYLSCSVIYNKYDNITILVNGDKDKYEPLVLKKLALMNCEAYYARPPHIEDDPNLEKGPLIGYTLGNDYIKIAYVVDERY